jgi:DNA-binding NarL/FixJ family response regulator
MAIRILLADDHPLLLNGTKAYLEAQFFEVVDTATDGIEAYHKTLKHQPELVIVDYDMPKQNGIELAKALKKIKFPVKVILLTLHKQEAILQEVGKSIAGYLTKDTAMEELSNCIKTVLASKTFVSPSLQKSIHFDLTHPAVEKLTASELKILSYIEQNYTSSQIAEALFISKRTVEKHRSNIIEKLGLPSSAHALLLWLKQHPGIF